MGGCPLSREESKKSCSLFTVPQILSQKAVGESVSGQAFRTEERLFCCPLIWCYSPGGDAFSISKTRFLPLCRWQGPLTHTATHTGKRADGSNGRKRAGKDDTPDQKGHKRPGKQKTSSSQSVGKDEVSGSNPDSSSIKPHQSGYFKRNA